MIAEIIVQESPFYYRMKDEVASNLVEYLYEFDEWLSQLVGNHPFKTYWETVDSVEPFHLPGM